MSPGTRRSDDDALPVREATGTYLGETVPAAHACGHDAHMAMLMGASILNARPPDASSG